MRICKYRYLKDGLSALDNSSSSNLETLLNYNVILNQIDFEKKLK